MGNIKQLNVSNLILKRQQKSMTNHVQITHDLYKWLVQYEILPNTQKYKASGNFQLQFRLQQQLQCGYLIAKLLTNLAAQKNIALNGPLMSSIKNSNTPAARVYNWNILNQGFLKLGITLPKQNQKQISSGNFDSLVRFLLDIQNKSNTKKLQKSSISPTPQQGLDIKNVRKYQQIQESQSVLEIIIILLSKSLGLTSKQAVATLAQSAKYLAHMIVKGVKGSFDEIITFIDDARNRMDKIMYLVEKDPQKNIQFLLQVFKPTLISREPDVAIAGALALKALNYECVKYNSKNLLYQIISKQNQGFDFIYMGLKRHPYLNYQIFDFLHPLLQNVLKDFFEVQLKKTINNEQQIIKTTILLLQPLLQNKQAKQQIFKSGMFEVWQKNYTAISTSKLKGKDMIGMNQQTKYQHLQLMYTLWLGYYKQMSPQIAQQLLIKITDQLKKNTRSQVYTIRIPSLLKIFNILDFLASNKNKLAALLYKKLIFLFVQNHNQDQMRQIVLQNLTLIIRKFSTIPLQYLLEPMLKQLTAKEGTSYILNMYDFQFIIEVCKHPKMQEYYAITFLDYFIKLYTKSVIYSSLIFRIIEAITARFCQSDQIREYCLRSTDVCLNNYGMLVMGKSKANKAMYQKQKQTNKQQNIINNQKKSLIIELLKHFVSLEHKQMTQQLKLKVATLFVDWYQNRNHYDKGLASILMEIGDIQEIVIQFKQKQIQESLKQQSRQSERTQNQQQGNGPSQFSRLSDHRNGMDKSKVQNKQSMKYEQDYQISNRGSPNLEDIGLGYKKKRNLPNKYEVLPSRSRNIKPDPKVLQDLQKIKQKWKLDQSRAKLQQIEAKKDKTGRLNQKQLLQRNISLGYAKLPELNNDQILFDYDSVKKRHLKDSLDLINLEQQQQRQEKSYVNVIKRYQKYIKSLFLNYANKSGMIDQKQSKILAFTQVMRMLKDKGLLNKIPKIAINQIICSINQKRKKQKNILGGIYQQDFPSFILHLTDLLMKQDAVNKKDEPFGLKAQKIILKLLDGEKNVKQLFDPNIQKLKQDLQYNQNLQIPSDFKKIKQTQVQLSYMIRSPLDSLNESYVACYQLVDGIVYQAIGVHIVSPFTDFKQKLTLARINKPAIKMHSQSTDKKLQRSGTQQIDTSLNANKNDLLNKDILADSHNSFTKPLKKLSKNIIKRKSQSQRNIGTDEAQKSTDKAEKDKKRQAHAKKLKQQILKLRQQKQKHQAEKKQKQKQIEEKKKKKDQLRQQYLQQNKRKLKEKKEEDQKKQQQAKKQQEMKKQKRKAEVKQKQAQMVEKQKKIIEQKRIKLANKVKQKQFQQKQRDKFNKSKSSDRILNQMKTQAADQKMKDLLIKNSLDNGELKQIVEKNKKNFEDLFQSYWNWQKQKMQLKNLAEMFKDFQTAKYVSPKQIADVYKNTAKGQLLGLQNFIQCIVKLSFRSAAIEQQIKSNQRDNQQSTQLNKINIAQFQFMLKLLKMNEQNYKQAIIRTKKEKQQK